MENYSGQRLFLALNLSQEIKDSLNSLLDKLKNSSSGVKWCDSRNLHLTLNFLGQLDKKYEQTVITAMRNLAGKYGWIEFAFGSLGGFPNPNNAKVVFISCRQLNGGTVYKLQSQLSEKLKNFGLKVDKRPWQAHITLGRAKDAVKINSLADLAIPKAEFIVKTFELMESKLAPGGAEYKKVASFKL